MKAPGSLIKETSIISIPAQVARFRSTNPRASIQLFRENTTHFSPHVILEEHISISALHERYLMSAHERGGGGVGYAGIAECLANRLRPAVELARRTRQTFWTGELAAAQETLKKPCQQLNNDHQSPPILWQTSSESRQVSQAS